MAGSVVIVGASVAGGTAAATLRQEGFDGELVLIGAEPHPPYERPPLSKSFLRDETSFEDALVQPTAFWTEQGVDTRFGVEALAIDPAARNVTLADGDVVPFERLLIATGSRNRRFPIPGIDLPGVHELRSVDDAIAIKARIDPGRRAVVCGMGFIGSEVAASLRERGMEVTVIDSGSVPLQRVLGPEVGGVLEGIHRDHGIRMIHRDRVAAFEGTGRVEQVLTAGGMAVECDFAVLGLGVEPVTELAERAGVRVDDGIVTDERCRTDLDGIYAAGDVSNHFHPVFGRHLRVEHWENAIKQGRAAALAMLGRGEAYQPVHWFWSDQYGHNLQYAGHHHEWDDLVVRGSLEGRSFVAFYLLAGRVQAAVSLDRPRDVHRAMRLIRSGGGVDPARLRDEAVPLDSSS